MPVAKISAFVICFNRADVLATCLRALRFADELIVIDKSSTDGSNAIAQTIADRVVVVPWTPTVEETRALALSLCQHDWILFMDDDECLSASAGARIRAELENPRAAIYEFPLRHYILGRHDERAYYWPEHHVRLFRRGAVTFCDTIHAGINRHASHVIRIESEKGVCIHHLSNANVAGWLEKTNRYTANPDRDGIKPGPAGLAAFGHQRIDYWFGRTRDDAPDGYPAAAALLRAVYDMVDGLKSWETAIGLDGADLLREACARLDQDHEAGSGVTADMLIIGDLRAELEQAEQRHAELAACRDAAEQRQTALAGEILLATEANAALAQSNAVLAGELEASRGEAAELRGGLERLERRMAEVESISAAAQQQLVGMQASTSWRLTAGLRRVVIAVRGR